VNARAPITGFRVMVKPTAEPNPTKAATTGLTSMDSMDGTWEAKVAE
jgi:hypothetical protein